MINNEILTKIKASKKYSVLNQLTIDNIAISKSHSEESLRSKLHQVWGAYYTSYPDYVKMLKKISNKELDINSIAKIHSSTKERELESMNIMDYIFSIIGNGKKVIDVGSGLNPIFLLNRHDFKQYICVDIDSNQQNFFNLLFERLNLKNMKAIVGDALIETFEQCDAVFALKLLPVLDQVNPVQTNLFLQKLECKHLIVSFPNRSLGGKVKGMTENYRNLYLDRVEGFGFKLISEKLFNSEAVYIFEKQNRAV